MIINYSLAEEAILKVEQVLEDYDMEEKSYIMGKVRQRFAKQLQEMNVKNTVESFSIFKQAKKLLNKDEDTEGENE